MRSQRGQVAILRSFLSNRQQCVRIGTSYSQLMPITRGIPQGSVTGPILFCLFINDLRPVSDACSLYKYADDQTLTCPSISSVNPKLELENVLSWCEANHMTLNLAKTKEMVISVDPRLSREASAPSELTIKSAKVEQVVTLKLLGIHLSRNLRWDAHISYLERRCRADTYLLWRLRSLGMTCSSINALIISLILPKLTYAFPSWCNLNKTEMKSLATLYRRICNIGNPSDLPVLEDILDKSIDSLFRSALASTHSLHDLVPVPTNSRYNMRRNYIPLPLCRLSSLKSHFISKGVALYNKHV